MDIGGARLDNQVFAVAALESFGSVEGRPFTGIFGYEVFKRFVVKTDYENGRITLSDPGSWKYSGTGTRTPFQLKDTIPVVPGEIDGIAGTFQIDTGSRSSLDLMTPFVEKNNLVAKYKANMKGVGGWGIGGPAYSWFVRGHQFTFGGVSVEAPIVGLSQQKKGSFSDIYTAGNIGAGVLRRFNITWDYPHSQIFFEPNKNYAVRDVFDRAGLWSNLGAEGFDVIDVIAGAPAAEAGLEASDKIISVDGKRAGAEITLPEFRLRLKEPAGTKIKLEVLRGGQPRQIIVTLRDLV
jgi:hypothetical protein